MDERAVVLCFTSTLFDKKCWLNKNLSHAPTAGVLQNELAAVVMVANSVYHIPMETDQLFYVGLRLELESGQEQTLRALDVMLV